MKKVKSSLDKPVFWKKVGRFFRRNAYALTASACGLMVVVAFAVSIALKNDVVDVEPSEVPTDNIVLEDKVEAIEPSVPVATVNPLILVAPVENYSVGMVYAMDRHIYNETLEEWSVHQGIDLIAPAGTPVVASADGVVSDITYSILDGTSIVIEHTEGIKTVYKSLSNDVEVSVGDKVFGGQVVGTVSDSAGSEVKEGAHIHFEIWKDGQLVNPAEYIFDK